MIIWALVVVKWFLPFRRSEFESLWRLQFFVFEKNENIQKEAGMAQLKQPKYDFPFYFTHVEDHEHGNELSEGERDAELEGGEGRDHRGAPLGD